MQICAASGVYAITHIESGKRYIGSSHNMHRRLTRHKSDLLRGSHPNVKLQRAYLKYGIHAFTFTPIIVCAKHDLILFEQRAIDRFDSAANGYNIRPVAESSRGHTFKRGKYTAEHRAKISLAKKGKPGHTQTAETREKIRLATLGNKNLLGYIHTQDNLVRMSLAQKEQHARKRAAKGSEE